MAELNAKNDWYVNSNIIEDFSEEEVLKHEKEICKCLKKQEQLLRYIKNPTEKMYLAWCSAHTGHTVSKLPDWMLTEEYAIKLIPCGASIYETLKYEGINLSTEWLEAYVDKYPQELYRLHCREEITHNMWLSAKRSLKNTNILPKEYIDDELFERALQNGKIKYAYDLIIQGYDNYERIYQVLEDPKTLLYDKVKNRYVMPLNYKLYKMPCLKGHEEMYKKLQCIKESD